MARRQRLRWLRLSLLAAYLLLRMRMRVLPRRRMGLMLMAMLEGLRWHMRNYGGAASCRDDAGCNASGGCGGRQSCRESCRRGGSATLVLVLVLLSGAVGSSTRAGCEAAACGAADVAAVGVAAATVAEAVASSAAEALEVRKEAAQEAWSAKANLRPEAEVPAEVPEEFAAMWRGDAVGGVGVGVAAADGGRGVEEVPA